MNKKKIRVDKVYDIVVCIELLDGDNKDDYITITRYAFRILFGIEPKEELIIAIEMKDITEVEQARARIKQRNLSEKPVE